MFNTIQAKLSQSYLSLSLAFFSLFVSSNSMAKGDAAALFNPVNEKMTSVATQFTSIASVVCLIAIVCFGIATMTSNFNKKWGMFICLGATIILVAAQIADFLLK